MAMNVVNIVCHLYNKIKNHPMISFRSITTKLMAINGTLIYVAACSVPMIWYFSAPGPSPIG